MPETSSAVFTGRPDLIQAEKHLDLAPDPDHSPPTVIGCHGCHLSVPLEVVLHSDTHLLCFNEPVDGDEQRCVFEDDEVVQLVGFEQEHNEGIFRVRMAVGSMVPIRVAHRIRQCYELLTVAHCEPHGRAGWMRDEPENDQGAALVGKYGHFAGPTSDAMTISVLQPNLYADGERSSVHIVQTDGNARLTAVASNNSDVENVLDLLPRLLLKGSPRALAMASFQRGELVLLHGFNVGTNNGLFIVRSIVEHRTNITLWVDTAPLQGQEAYNASQCPFVKDIPSLVPPIQPNLVPETEAVIRAVQCPVECMRHADPSRDMFGATTRGVSHCCSGHGLCAAPRKSLHDPPIKGELELHKHKGDHVCECYPSFSGRYCEEESLPCPSNCTYSKELDVANGVCDHTTGKCTCNPVYWGLDCSQLYFPCPKDCSGHGRCDTQRGKCDCDGGWVGVACSRIEFPCPKNCSHHGICLRSNGKCDCYPSWEGVACDTTRLPCPKCCIENCIIPSMACDHARGACRCKAGYGGIDCCKAPPPPRLIPTGEMNQKNYAKNRLPSPLSRMIKQAGFLVYSNAGPLIAPNMLRTVFGCCSSEPSAIASANVDSDAVVKEMYTKDPGLEHQQKGKPRISYNTYSSFNSPMPPMVELTDRACKYIFYLLDSDHNGVVTLREFTIGVLARESWVPMPTCEHQGLGPVDDKPDTVNTNASAHGAPATKSELIPVKGCTWVVNPGSVLVPGWCKDGVPLTSKKTLADEKHNEIVRGSQVLVGPKFFLVTKVDLVGDGKNVGIHLNSSYQSASQTKLTLYHSLTPTEAHHPQPNKHHLNRTMRGQLDDLSETHQLTGPAPNDKLKRKIPRKWNPGNDAGPEGETLACNIM